MIQWHKWKFALPSLFTLTSIFCGFWALTLCAHDAGPSQIYQAALAIFFAMFFDGFDGRVARLTKTQSDFGVELDSLADVISFGAAPALLLYKWALMDLGTSGVFIAFAFLACGALRLARFNVLAHNETHKGGGRHFVGLPIPLAAGTVVSMVFAHHGLMGGELDSSLRAPLAGVVLGLSALMVSTVRYRTFKDVRLSSRSFLTFLAIVLSGVLIALWVHPALVLFAYVTSYLVIGIIESAIGLRQEHLARKTGRNIEEDDGEEEDYL